MYEKMYVCMYVWKKCMYGRKNVCTYEKIDVYMKKCMYVCMLCMYVWKNGMYVCKYVCI